VDAAKRKYRLELKGFVLSVLQSRDCHRRVAYNTILSTGAKMARTKKIVRREWTKDDIRQMKAMAKAKAGVKKISRTLERTPGATSVMAAKLGVSLSMRS
jgi:hypothetical protein